MCLCETKYQGGVSHHLGEALTFCVATPAEPCGEKKKLFFVQILGGEKLLKFVESAGEIFLSGLRGAKTFSNTFRIVFRIFFAFFKSFFVSI